jgi:hypothetical protein
MSQLTNPYIFTATDSVTATKLNNMISQTTIGPEVISTQNEKTNPISADVLLGMDSTTNQLFKVQAGNVYSSGLTTLSINGATNSDITIIPKDGTLVTGKNYTSADGSTVVVNSTAHGLSVGQIVQTSSAAQGSFNGTFKLIAANTDTFTYTIPTSVLPSSGTFSTTNGTLVTVTTVTPHGLTTGNTVAFVTSNSAFNITTTITVVSTTTFTYSLSTAYGTGSGSFSSSDGKYTTVTTSSNHNLVTGTSIAVTASNTSFSGTYPITSLTGTTFAYSTPSAPVISPVTASAVITYQGFTGSPYYITINATAHGLTTGSTVVVTCTSGNTEQNAYISGTYTITVVNANSFTCPKTTYVAHTSSAGTLSCSYTPSIASYSGTVTYALGGAYTNSVSYTVSPSSIFGTLSYYKKGAVKNTGTEVVNGNLYVDGMTTLNSDIRLVGNMTNFGTLTQNGAVTQNGTVIQTGTVNITGALQIKGVPAYVLYSNESSPFRSMTNYVSDSNSVPVRIATPVPAGWYTSSGFLHGTDNLVVPAGEVWEVNYVFHWNRATDDSAVFASTINDVAFNPDANVGIGGAWTSFPASVSKVLTAGTYAIRFKSAVVSGSGGDATYCDPYGFGSRNLKKYKVS